MPNDRYHNIFHLREDHTDITLSDDIEIHFLELAKLEHMSLPIQGGLINWLLFLRGSDKSNWEVLQMAKGLLEEGIPVHIIAKTSGLSEAEITDLKQEKK